MDIVPMVEGCLDSFSDEEGHPELMANMIPSSSAIKTLKKINKWTLIEERTNEKQKFVEKKWRGNKE